LQSHSALEPQALTAKLCNSAKYRDIDIKRHLYPYPYLSLFIYIYIYTYTYLFIERECIGD
jgi:hypothetical protein